MATVLLKEFDKLMETQYDVYAISAYATRKLTGAVKDYAEIMTEYQVKILLGEGDKAQW